MLLCACARVTAPRSPAVDAASAPASPAAPVLSPIVVAMPASAEVSIESVGAYLRASAPDPAVRLEALHDWMADRIAYDPYAVKHPTPPEDADAQMVFDRRMGVCEGYARLFVALARASGLDVSYVLGVARLSDGTIALHAWNAARAGSGRVEPIDVTWDAGWVDDAGVYRKEFSRRYFRAPADVFARDHQSLADAARQLSAGCDSRTVDTCLGLADLLHWGSHGVQRDLEMASSLFRAACDAHSSEACFDLAWDYEDGNGVPENAAMGASLLRRACDQGYAAGCNDAGVMYSWGRGVPMDPLQARTLFIEACAHGEVDGCRNLGVLE